MARFSKLAKGSLEGEVIDFEVRPSIVDKIRVLPLLGALDADIAKFAREFAVSRGAQPVDADKEYNLAIYAQTLLLACKDPDSPPDRLEPYFASVEEILDKDHGLDRGRIALLYEHQMRVQEQYGPKGGGTLTAIEFFEWFEKTTEADEGVELPFERSPRAKQRAFVRGIARLARASLLGKSGHGPRSPDMATSSESAVSDSTIATPAGGEVT